MDDTGSMAGSMEASSIGTWTRARKRDLPSKGKKFKYTWDLSDGTSGFIVQKKAKNKKQFQMYLDANEDGVFNRSDRLVVGGKLSQGYRNSKPGDLIDFSDSALITAKPYDPESHSGDDHNGHDHSTHDHSAKAPLGINELGYQHLSFLDADMNQVFHDHGAAHTAHSQEMV